MSKHPASPRANASLDIRIQDLDFGNETGLLLLESTEASKQKLPRIVYASESAARILGRPSADLVGNPVFLAWETESGKAAWEELHTCLLAKKPWCGDLPLPGGKPGRWASVQVIPEKTWGNHSPRWIFWIQETSAVKSEALELRKTNKIYEIQLNSTRRSMLVIDESWQVHRANPRLMEIWQIPQETIRSRNGDHYFSHILKNIENPSAFAEVLKNLREKKHECASGDLLLPTNRILEYRCTHCQTDDGDFSGWVWYFEDVTLQRRYEERLEQARFAAESASKAKSSFLANVSHEIRTPLNGIMGMTEILSRTLMAEDQRDFLNTVQTSADNLLTLINDILDLSKIEAGKVDLENHHFDLQRMIEDALAVVAPRLGDKPIDLAYHIESACPHLFSGDNRRISQILVNLLGNAVKFTDQGEIVVEASYQPPVAEDRRQEPHLVIAIRDTGIGITAKDLQTLFTNFTQVDSSTTRRHGGTGLGLSISHRLVELMEGRIWGQSEPGRGSTFQYRIPLPAVDQEKNNPTAAEWPGKKMLIVDDSAACRRMLQQQARQMGMMSIIAENPRKALSINEKPESLDLIVIDAQIHGMDGLMLARSLRKSNRRPDIPIILLTTLSNFAAIKQDADELNLHLMTKPVRIGQLASVIGLALGQTESPSPSAPRMRIPDLTQIKILLAEDNSVNRMVTEQLFLQFDKSITSVINGREAVEMWEKERYNIIFMDIHMPEMDGLEATRKIRQISGSDRQPWIVALTAGALIEDRQRCMEAGMNDYLSKPIKLRDLVSALANHPSSLLEMDTEKPIPTNPPARSEADYVFERLRALSMGDEAFLQKVVEVFLTDFPGRLDALDLALTGNERDNIRIIAHTIKGSCGNLGANRLAQTAKDLEKAAADGDQANLVSLAATLRRDFNLLREDLQSATFDKR